MDTYRFTHYTPMNRLPFTRGRQHGHKRPWRNAEMTGTAVRTRATVIASLSVALAVLTAGCADTSHDGTSSTAAADGGTASGVASSPGRLSVHTADVDLTIT
jgi:hypothetical protein